ncbi:YadA-like family protein [Haemophilus sp. SZY H36]|uniref:YadA-like family protein n=1 Tax=Haemophilus sp. SZY H36 TaxID=2839968 RepID=UPI001C04819C|nr:YadA-like family protein [Haemophilus sp. SZY H36]
MNKIFRIVWSQATQSWVVVSELTKAHKKQSSSNSQGSAVKFSGNFIKSSAIALTLLSGHSAYAATAGNTAGQGIASSVAFGPDSNASQDGAVALGKQAIATGTEGAALGKGAKAQGNLSVAVGVKAQASANNAMALGLESKATKDNAVALGRMAEATQESAVALGFKSKATSFNTVALGTNTEAAGQRSMAFGNEAKATANDTIAFGSSSEAKKNNDIIIGKEAKSRDEGGGHSVAVGYNATAGSNKTGAATDVTRTGTNEAAGGVAIGVSSYTGLNRNNTAINSSVAIGAGAGAGYRAIGADGLPTGNGTDPDDNAKVLVKAFGGTTSTLDYFKNTGDANKDGFFSFQNVDINEGTALGRNTRAIGDQSVALGAQSIAGQGSIVIGGNDIKAYVNKKYFKAESPTSGPANTVNDFDAPTTPATGKNGQPITITNKYRELVGVALDDSYRASYGQDGSTVIGMQAHSTTPLGVAIGTNSIVRKGAFGSTAIGSGASVLANAEAAVAIGMGAEAQGNYAVAAGTAARAKESAVAAGYQANADKSAVAVGDSSKATTSSVAVGQLAQATKEADIAVGQGAKASGNQGAIAMGLGTNAQGDSSIMIGGANIDSASKQNTTYEKANGQISEKTITEIINGHSVQRKYSFAGTTTTTGTVDKAYKELTGRDMDTSAINFADTTNKNGHASTSLGVHALSRGDLGTAIGASSRADSIGSVALGVGARATKQNAVAIGTGSTTDLVGTRQLSVNYNSDGEIVSDNSTDIAYTFKWAGGTNTSEGDVVSFGSSGAERQLKNVAAGRVAEDSTDAINGSQLNSITKKIAGGFHASGNVVTGSSGEFTSKKASVTPADSAYESAIRPEDKVQFQVGNNLKLDRDETEVEVEVPDDFDKTKKVKKKIRKADFAYSLNPVLTNLTSAEFKGKDANAPTTKLTNAGVTITPVTAGKSPVSLTENGLNNGGNAITDVAGNLDGAKANTNAPTTNATKPATLNNSNAATVGDVLNAGWNLQGNTTAKDFVTAYDTVNFVDGDGTTVSVENTDGKTSTIKYSANLGDGLKKDDATNKITVNAADKSLTVGSDGVKVNTGNINTAAVPTVDAGDENKIATVGNVADAIKAAAWKATSAATTSGENTGKKEQEVKAGDTVTFEADKNIKIAQDNGKFTFSTKDDVVFETVQLGGDQGPKLSKTDEGDLKVSGSNGTDPVKVTNVKSGLDTYGGNVPGTTAKNTGLVDLSKPTTGEPKVSDNTAATVGDLRNMGWVVSSDKTTGELTKAYTDQVKNADEVKFVGEGGVTVSGKTENGVRTITVKAEAQEMPEQPVSYTTADGTKVYPKTVTKPDGTKETKYYPNPDGTGTEIPKENVIASINGPEGTKAPTTLSNVAGNLDGAKKGTTAPTTEHGPVNTADKNAVNYVNPNNAATVGDVLNAGWNLQNNGTAKDFVKPYDTVNFVDGINTKAVVTTDAEGKVSNVQIDVKDLPIAYTNEAGDKVVKAADGKYYKESDLAGKVYDPKTNQFKNADGTALKEQPTEVAGDTVKTNLVNPNAKANKAGDATQLGNVANGANTFDPVDDKKMANDGKWYPANQVEPNGQPKKDASPVAVPNNIGKAGLIDFSKSNPNNAATVGDLQNLGWIVSAKGNDYSDQVRNANEVKFVGEGTASVTGKTDENGVRTITVKVDDQVSTNNAQMPVNYTTADGTKVYPVKDENGNVTYHTTPDGKGQGDKEIQKGDVITSINGPEGTTAPTTLSNVAGNLDGAKKDTKAPTTEHAPVNTTDKNAVNYVNPNNAATVGDVLNAGWNLQNNDTAKDFVKPYDTVNFVDGINTKAVVTTDAEGKVSNVTFNVDMAEMTPETDGSVKGPVSQDLLDALDKAQEEFDKNPNDEAAKNALEAAEKAVNEAGGNKVANAQNVADMINSSGFTLKTSEVDGGKKVAGTKDNGELINPGKTVEMVAGKNMSVKQDENGKVTYATKDDVEFNTVNVGEPETYKNAAGETVVKGNDGKFYKPNELNADGKPNEGATGLERDKVTVENPQVTLKREAAKEATNNANKPSSALNVSSSDGKPTQIKGVGSVLNIEDVDTKGDQVDPNGNVTTPAKEAKDKLVNLGTNPKKDDKPLSEETLNSAATVRDLANMGWVVSAKDNNYTNTVKNANKVEFKGDNGISVTGKDVTQADGTVTREITVAIADGKVTDKVTITKDGKDIPAIKIGDNYYEVDKNGKPVGYEVDEKGKPTANNKPIDVAGATITNEGNKVVTGNTVATAIQESGWNVGLADSSKANEAFNDDSKALSANKLEKVNPNDNVRFADGKGTKAAVATVERVDEFGKKVTDTYVKFDVDAGEITADTTKPGAVKGPVTVDEAKKLADDLKKAEQAVKDLPADATPETKKAAQDALKLAQDAAAPLNKVATAQNVAEAINNSGWRTNSTTATGGAKDTLINPGKAVNFEAGKNMEVAQTVDKDGNVAYTYKTKDNVQFNSVQFGGDTGPKISNNDGNINVSGPDGKAPTKITGVAAGDISPNSTDAVNGAQIYALVGDQSNVNQTSPTYTKVDLDENGKPSYTTVNAPAGKTVVTAKDDNGHDVPVLKTYNVHSQKEIVTNSVVEAIHNMNEQGIKFFHSNDGVERPKQEQTNSFDSSASGKFATAIGSRSKADGTNAVAIGFNSVVTGNDSISIGTGNRVTGNNSGAFGDPSTVSGQGSYSVGNNNTVATNDTFVLGNEVKHTVENSAILGAKSTARGGNGSKTGTLRNLKQDGTQGASTTAGSTGTVSTATVGHMTYGGFQGDKADGVVSVGAAGNERRIQNVAAGEISKTSTDAINGSQLYAVAAGIGHKLGDLDNKINKVGKRGDAGTASALAAANIPQAYTPGKSLVGIAAGSYQGQNGLAVGMSRISDNGKIIIRLSGTANSQGKTGVAAGVGYQW